MRRFNFLPVDYVVLIYNLIVAISIVIFRERVSHWFLYFAFNLAIVIFVLLVSTLPTNPSNLFLKIIRRWYFLLLLLFLYEETGGLVFLYVPYWLDNGLAVLEKGLWGVHPNLFLEKFNFVILNEYFMFGYLMYFGLILSYAIVLFWKKMYFQLDMYITTAALTFLTGFFAFYFFPIAGPRFLFANVFSGDLNGVLFVPAVNYVVAEGAAQGGSMPSTHTAAAVVILVQAWRYIRPLGYIYAPIVLGLMIGTFWGRFHFVSDTLAGLALAIACILITDWVVGKKKLGTSRLYPDQPIGQFLGPEQLKG